MTERIRINIYINEELFKAYKEAELSLDKKKSIKKLYRYISHAIYVLFVFTFREKKNITPKHIRNTYINRIEKEFGEHKIRKVVTITNNIYYLLADIQAEGYSISNFVNVALYSRYLNILKYKQKQ